MIYPIAPRWQTTRTRERYPENHLKKITVPSKQPDVPPDISGVPQLWPKQEASQKVHFKDLDTPSNSGDDIQWETKVESESDNDSVPEQNSESDIEVAKAVRDIPSKQLPFL